MWGETKVRRAGRGGPLFCALSWFFRGQSQAAAPLRSACHVATQECGSRGAQSFSFAVEFLSVIWNPIFKCWQLFHMFKESTLASLTRVPGNCFWKLNRDTETTGTARMGDTAQDSEPEEMGSRTGQERGNTTNRSSCLCLPDRENHRWSWDTVRGVGTQGTEV